MNYKIGLALLAVLLMARPLGAKETSKDPKAGQNKPTEEAQPPADSENPGNETDANTDKSGEEEAPEAETDAKEDPWYGNAYEEATNFGGGFWGAVKSAGSDIWAWDERPCQGGDDRNKRIPARHDRFTREKEE